MKTFDLNSFAVSELQKTMLIEFNGGESQPIPSPNPWWSIASSLITATYIIVKSAAEAYIQASMDTGGKYVIHHAQ